MTATEGKSTDVPDQVFEDFLARLAEAEVSDEDIVRLRQTLLVDKKFTAPALKAAVFGEGA